MKGNNKEVILNELGQEDKEFSSFLATSLAWRMTLWD
jgi:hypothetical protein